MEALVLILAIAFIICFVALGVWWFCKNDNKGRFKVTNIQKSTTPECCANCWFRYPMSAIDLEHFPCKSKHRCSTDGTIIPDMSYWCPDYLNDEKDDT